MVNKFTEERLKKIRINKMVKAEQYLEMWLSEQIPTNEWLRILEENSEVRELYNKHTKRMKTMEGK